MELTMGTPISRNALALKLLEALVLDDKTPDSDDLEAVGLDVKLLAQRYQRIREDLGLLEGFEDLQSLTALGHPLHTWNLKPWSRLVDDAGLTKERVLRFTSPTATELALFRVERGDLEVFLARSGKWIVWCGGYPAEQYPSTFTQFNTASGVVKRIRRILDQFGSRREPHVALRLRDNLARFVDETAEAKDKRAEAVHEMQRLFAQSRIT